MYSEEKHYIWQSDDWPGWRYDLSVLAGPLTEVSRAQGLLLGRLADVGLALRDQAGLAALTEDVVKTSAIEGEVLNVESVRSSIARHLGVDIGAVAPVRRAGAHAERHTRCHRLAVVVSRHAPTRHRQRADHTGCRMDQGTLLATLGGHTVERAAGEDAESSARWLRGQAYEQQVGGNSQMLARYLLNGQSGSPP